MEQQTKTNCRELLEKTAFRLRLNSFFHRAYFFTFILLAIYAILLLLCRLLAIIPDYFTYTSLLIPVSIGILAGLLIHPRPTIRESAKLADSHTGTKDLFLTATLIDDSFGEYQALVVKDAESEAEKVIPSRIVQLKWYKGLRNLLIALTILVLGSAFIPQLDPFGRELARKKKKEQKEKLTAMDKAVKDRLKTLKRRKSEKNSPEIAKLLDKAKQEFNTMKKSKMNANKKRLKELQRELGNAWRRKNESKMRDRIEQNISKQSFGMKNRKEAKWKEQLSKNNFSGIQKEARELQKMAQKISAMGDSEEKKKMQQEFRKRMKSMADFMASQLGSQSVQGAIKQAMGQLDMAGLEGMDKEALKALNNSMDLMNRELERLGEMSRDIRDLEMAMQASQLARQLNKMKQLQGAGRQGFEEIKDYADYYNQMMKNAQACEKGKGCGKPGGGGKKPDENPDVATNEKKEISKSKLQAGKIVMRWKTKGMGKSGQAKEEYLQSLKKVKQGVSEAILKEQIPPGYHESIQKYFDNLKEK